VRFRSLWIQSLSAHLSFLSWGERKRCRRRKGMKERKGKNLQMPKRMLPDILMLLLALECCWSAAWLHRWPGSGAKKVGGVAESSGEG